MEKLPMRNYIRLAYISRATETNTIRIQEVNNQIISEALQFNEKNNITGILFFDNRCYFQCLEGPKEVVERLYTKIAHDSRHKDIKTVIKEPITSLSFANWQMKYVVNVALIIPLVRLHGHKNFSPYDFTEYLFKDLLDCLSQKCEAARC